MISEIQPSEDIHIGRSFPGTEPTKERDCPCRLLPCGLVSSREANAITCPEHSLIAGQTIRSMHRASQCTLPS